MIIPGFPDRGTPPPLQDSDAASITESISGKFDREGSAISLEIDTKFPQPPVVPATEWSPSASLVIPEPPLGWFGGSRLSKVEQLRRDLEG